MFIRTYDLYASLVLTQRLGASLQIPDIDRCCELLEMMKDLPAEEEVELLLSLSSCAAKPMKIRRRRTRRRPDGTFECRTCGRGFPSFQSLGGHRTSCDREPRMGPATARGWKLRPVVHRCSVCGEAFATGQALGGHVRRHRAPSAGGDLHPYQLDLNLTPHTEVANGCHARLLQLFN